MSSLCNSNVYREIHYYTSANLHPLFYTHPSIGIIFATLSMQYSNTLIQPQVFGNKYYESR